MAKAPIDPIQAIIPMVKNEILGMPRVRLASGISPALAEAVAETAVRSVLKRVAVLKVGHAIPRPAFDAAVEGCGGEKTERFQNWLNDYREMGANSIADLLAKERMFPLTYDVRGDIVTFTVQGWVLHPEGKCPGV